jgi:4,5-dihydroxyphthalate decarboxylase
VVPIPEGKKIEDMLTSGELVAAIGVDVDHPDVGPLIPNGEEEGLKAFRKGGNFPINHTVVIKDELIEKYPDLAADVFNAFAESKRQYIEKLKAGQIEKMTDADKTAKAVMDAKNGEDPFPYGIEPNRKVLEDLIQTALTQRIITKPVAVEDLFAPSTRNLKG